jgi:plastocyanin
MSHGTQLLSRTTLLALALAGVVFPAVAAETAVDQLDLTFIPNAVTINAGDAVRFTNSDRIAHNVTVVNPDGTSEDKGMDAYQHGILVPFPKPGVYHVKCKIHPAMTMTVTVK